MMKRMNQYAVLAALTALAIPGAAWATSSPNDPLSTPTNHAVSEQTRQYTLGDEGVEPLLEVATADRPNGDQLQAPHGQQPPAGEPSDNQPPGHHEDRGRSDSQHRQRPNGHDGGAQNGRGPRDGMMPPGGQHQPPHGEPLQGQPPFGKPPHGGPDQGGPDQRGPRTHDDGMPPAGGPNHGGPQGKRGGQDCPPMDGPQGKFNQGGLSRPGEQPNQHQDRPQGRPGVRPGPDEDRQAPDQPADPGEETRPSNESTK